MVTVGKADTEPTLRKALAIGADDAVRIDAEPKDTFQVAEQLADFVKQDPYDIIFAGIESSDYNHSMVGGMLAEFLDCDPPPATEVVYGTFLGLTHRRQ